MFDDYDPMEETPPRPPARHLLYDPERYSSGGSGGAWIRAYAGGAGVVIFGIGAVVYVKRRDWLRAIVCAAFSSACGYVLYRAILG